MNNIDIANMGVDAFIEAYQKAVKNEKTPINSSDISLEGQLQNFKAASFSDQDSQALHEDMLSI